MSYTRPRSLRPRLPRDAHAGCTLSVASQGLGLPTSTPRRAGPASEDRSSCDRLVGILGVSCAARGLDDSAWEPDFLSIRSTLESSSRADGQASRQPHPRGPPARSGRRGSRWRRPWPSERPTPRKRPRAPSGAAQLPLRALAFAGSRATFEPGTSGVSPPARCPAGSRRARVGGDGRSRPDARGYATLRGWNSSPSLSRAPRTQEDRRRCSLGAVPCTEADGTPFVSRSARRLPWAA